MSEPQKIELPPAYLEIVEELSAAVSNAQPDDVYQFCANFLNRKLEEQRVELVAIAKSAQEAGFQFVEMNNAEHDHNNGHPVNSADAVGVHSALESNGTFGHVEASNKNIQRHDDHHYQHSLHDDDDDDDDDDDEEDDDDDDDEEEEEEEEPTGELPTVTHLPLPNRGRRTSVSAESMAPTSGDDFAKIVIPKTEQQRRRIETSISNNFLFKNLDEEQYKDVVNAMSEKRISAGEVIIEQGGIGDYFYVVEVGTLDVFVSRDGGIGTKVLDYGPGGSFGELALMYNAPRAATVKATSDCILWALDRVTFRRILMERTSRKRRMYELFLEEVPLLKSLEPYERHKIADALESVVYKDGDIVIEQDAVGDTFYIIESGYAGVCQVDANNVRHELPGLEKGDYFGELALMNNGRRAATIYAKGRLKCATLNKKAFSRLLGPAVEIIKRNSVQYKRNSKIALQL